MITKSEWNDDGWIGYFSENFFCAVVIHDIDNDEDTVAAQYYMAGEDEISDSVSTKKRNYKLYSTAPDKEGYSRDYFIIYRKRIYLDDVMHRASRGWDRETSK